MPTRYVLFSLLLLSLWACCLVLVHTKSSLLKNVFVNALGAVGVHYSVCHLPLVHNADLQIPNTYRFTLSGHPRSGNHLIYFRNLYLADAFKLYGLVGL